MGSPGRTPLTDHLVERIARAGPLTFAAFMEACLYHPEHGYYTRRVPATGPRDYVTSPEVGPLFGRLLAWQLQEMSERMGQPTGFDLVECGAGGGPLPRALWRPLAGRPAGGGESRRPGLAGRSRARSRARVPPNDRLRLPRPRALRGGASARDAARLPRAPHERRLVVEAGGAGLDGASELHRARSARAGARSHSP